MARSPKFSILSGFFIAGKELSSINKPSVSVESYSSTDIPMKPRIVTIVTVTIYMVCLGSHWCAGVHATEEQKQFLLL